MSTQPDPSGSPEYSEKITHLRAEISSLQRHLSDLETEERDSQEQLQSLTYAADLTRSEALRRRRANSELDTAYQSVPPLSRGDGDVSEVQRLEGALLNAKRDAANVVFEVEKLRFRLKKLKETMAKGVEGGVEGVIVAHSSPGGILSPGGMLTPPGGGKVGRLIGDVDALVGVGGGVYIGCRVGVGANGQMGLYSYGGNEVVMALDDRTVKREALGKDDELGLEEGLRCVDLMDGNRVCGLWQAVSAVIQLSLDTREGIKTDDGDIAERD